MGNMVAETKQSSPISIPQAHEKLGHMSEKSTINTVKPLIIPLKKGNMKPCVACAAGKAKQKNIKRTTVTKQKFGQQQEFLDLESVCEVKEMPIPPKPHWRIIVVDQEIQIKFSKFFKQKDKMTVPTCEQLYQWKQSKLGGMHL